MGEAFGYVRTSTKGQEISPEMQEEEIRRVCDYRRIKLVYTYKDIGISGGSMERPQLLLLLNDLKANMFVVIYDLQRLSRNTEDACFIYRSIKEKGGKLICKNPDIDFSTSQGEFVYELLISFGKMEKQSISKRVSDNMKQLSGQGKLRSRPPYGWKKAQENYKEKPYEKDEEQQKVIEMIRVWYAIEHMSLAGISKKLNDEGYNKTLGFKKGTTVVKNFFPNTIRKILIYQGLIKDPNVKTKPVNERYMQGKSQIKRN